MENIIRRLITCQGSIQLASALAAISHQDQFLSSNIKTENYLVIYDLFSSPGQEHEFVDFLEKMAKEIISVTKIIYLSPEYLSKLSKKALFINPCLLPDNILKLFKQTYFDEVYLSKEWQFSNKLILKLFSYSKKICYGDGFGIYVKETNPMLATTPTSRSGSFKDSLRKLALVFRDRHFINITFDEGFFILPTAFDDKPDFNFTLLDKSIFLNIFIKFKPLIDQRWLEIIRSEIKNKQVTILLTSNFSEAGRCSQEKEIDAYIELISKGSCSNKESILLLKPHPRDSIDKLNKIKVSLAARFENVLFLDKSELFFIPFETLYLSLFQNSSSPPNIITVSSACLSIKSLFNNTAFAGFGEIISKKLFYSKFINNRLKHEQALASALEHII
jgi:hypothetical protein